MEYNPLRSTCRGRRTDDSLVIATATILASSNTPPGTVHRILGHANFATTMKRYGGLTAEALDKAAGALGEAFEPKKEELKRS